MGNRLMAARMLEKKAINLYLCCRTVPTLPPGEALSSVDDPYKLLGVARDATADQIKSSYRKLARKLHPDLHPGDKVAEDKFKRVSVAYDLLNDPTKRARFDAGEIDESGTEKRQYRRSSAGTGSGGGFGGGFKFGDNADDIFSELLRRRNKGKAGAGSGGKHWFEEEDEPAMRGADSQYSLKVPFAEAALGTTKRITLPTGKSLDIKVPAGTKDATTLRLKGQGNPGRHGGPAGDALIEIKVEPHPFFTREGDDVLITLPITLPEAVLGGKVTVPTIDGKVALSIPANSSSGVVMRLKGKGIPHGKGRGDQMVTLKIVLPEKADADLEHAVKSWSAKHSYDVRARLGME